MSKLSEYEVDALRNEAQGIILSDAVERLRHDEHTESMMGAAEVYGALAHLRFHEVKGLPEPAEVVDVKFTDRAMAWLGKLQSDISHALEGQRRSVEVNKNTAGETFLSFVLDGIAEAVTT